VRLKRALAHEVLVEESKRLVVQIKRLAPDRRCFKRAGGVIPPLGPMRDERGTASRVIHSITI
jgi:hypothetical protein